MTILRSEGAGESSGDFYGYKIGQSLRFDSVRSTVLTRTATTPTDGKKATWSFWIKKSEVTTSSGSYKSIFYAGTPNSNGFRMGFRKSTSHNHEFTITMDNGSSAAHMFKYTDAAFRDASSWYHFVLRYDSTDSTAADRIKLYVNGTQQTFSSGTNVSPTLNRVPTFQVSGQTQRIGEGRTDVNEHINAYLAELHFVDGQALDPSSFGETKDGIWVAKEYSGSHGNNGFYLTFQATGTGTTAQGTTAQTNIGDDQSGEGHNFAVSALVASDVVPDSPTNNFATLNPLYSSISASYPTPALSEGNLAASTSSGSNWKTVPSTMYMSTGKWYAEVRVTYTDAVDSFIGFASSEFNGQNYAPSETAFGYQFHPSLGIRHNASQLSAQTFTQNDIIGLALNLDDNEIKFYKNGSLLYTATSVAAGSWSVALTLLYTKTLYANFGQDSSFAGTKTSGSAGASDANGNGDFYYAPPSGFLALCSSNLPEPEIIDGSEYFNTVLYTGNDGTQSITGVGFQPDLVWLKQRSAPTRSHRLNDSVRGANKQLYSNLTNTEGTATNELTSFDSDGFSLGSANGVNGIDTYVGWNWKAGTAFSNDASATGIGNVDSSGQVNTEAGFSIVSWQFTNSADNLVAHGLSSAPEMMIIKSRTTAYNWDIYHTGLSNPATKRLIFTSGSEIAGFFDTNPTSTVFEYNTSALSNNDNAIAYCFHSVDGYSKVGQYIGNYNVNGPFVYTGFRPAFIIIKSRVTAGYHWYMMDSTRTAYNGSQAWLSPSQTTTEDTSTGEEVDILSNGFKIRTNWTRLNDSGSPTYIYLAFAENPFKYANAR